MMWICGLFWVENIMKTLFLYSMFPAPRTTASRLTGFIFSLNDGGEIERLHLISHKQFQVYAILPTPME